MDESELSMALIDMGVDPDRAFEAVRHTSTLDGALDWLQANEKQVTPKEPLEREGASAVDTSYGGAQNPFAHTDGKAAAQYAPPAGPPPNLANKMASMTINGEPTKDIKYPVTDQDEPPSYPPEKGGSQYTVGNGSTSYPADKVPSSGSGPPSYSTEKGQGQSSKDQSQYPSEKSQAQHKHPPHHMLQSRSSYISGKSVALSSGGSSSQNDDQPGGAKLLFKRFTGDKQAKETHMQRKQDNADQYMQERWGPPGNPTYEIIMRYWSATHMKPHWLDMFEQNPNDFRRMIKSGYCEPIPTAWVRNRRLAYLNPEGSYFETPAEERLYYFLNNGRMPGVGKHPPLRPLNINRDRYAIIKRGNQRNARAHPLDPIKLRAYASRGDVFQGDRQIKSHEYSTQVDNIVYEARTKALHELADGIIHGTDHIETMLLIDVSGSMLWNPHGGIMGPDGITRYHDQPSNIRLVEHLVHRVLQHMVPRAQKEHPQQLGIDTVTFSNYGRYVGHLTAHDFKRDWSRVQLGGGTQVMQGWQVVKNTYFQHMHDRYGHGHFDNVFGWQPTPGMPKLSLLLFLDGECQDMDEFELELLGETWAYVTVALVGMEGCPHHHSHAIELERVAKFNPHVGFFDVHGRVCERMCVEDLLKSVYPVDPPSYDEILKPEFDLPPEELPAYKA